MKRHRFICAAIAIMMLSVWCTPAQALTLKEEEKLGREFLKYIRNQLVLDPMIVGYVNQVGRKLLAAMPEQPFLYKFYVVKSSVYNAFAIPAGHVFINSGLLADMESEDELAGILGHEIAHVVCRHIAKRIERSQKINLATMAGLIAGILVGSATGDTSAMSAITFGSIAAGQTATLSYSRQDETQADELGIQYLVQADYNPQGLQSVLAKIRSRQWFGSDQIPTYKTTHPAIEDRMAWIDNWMGTHPQSHTPVPASDDENKATFNKLRARIIALYDDTESAMKHFQSALAKTPKDPNLIYGYGLVLDRTGNRATAVQQLKKALTHNALDPFILGDLGRIYFTQGHYDQAESTLEGALTLKTDNPQSQFYLGRTYLASNQLNKAAESLETLLAKHPHYDDAYYYLGETYTKLKRMPDAHYNLGIFHFNRNDYATARFHFMRARRGIKDPAKQKSIEKYLKDIESRLKEMKKKEE